MIKRLRHFLTFALLFCAGTGAGLAAQAPHAASDPDVPLSAHDRVYTADQTSNTVSVYEIGRAYV